MGEYQDICNWTQSGNTFITEFTRGTVKEGTVIETVFQGDKCQIKEKVTISSYDGNSGTTTIETTLEFERTRRY